MRCGAPAVHSLTHPLARSHTSTPRITQENLKCSPAMLSRFDLVFLLLDRPDAERDQRLSEHVMALHSGKEGRAHAARARLLEGGRASQPLLLTDGRSGSGGGGTGRPPLLDRLRMRQRDDELLPVQVRC